MNVFVFILVVYVSLSSFVDGSKRFYISQSLINFVYKNFDIDAFDHSEFLFDEDSKREGDIKMQTYHDLVHTLKLMNVTTLVTSNDTYDVNLSNERKENVRFPTLHYISITSLKFSRITQYLANISNIALANDIWLIVFDGLRYTQRLTKEQFSKDVQELLPNLELDSQLFIILPMNSNRDNFELYEAYKVCTINLFRMNCRQFS